MGDRLAVNESRYGQRSMINESQVSAAMDNQEEKSDFNVQIPSTTQVVEESQSKGYFGGYMSSMTGGSTTSYTVYNIRT